MANYTKKQGQYLAFIYNYTGCFHVCSKGMRPDS